MRIILILFTILIIGCKAKFTANTKKQTPCNEELFSPMIKELIMDHVNGDNLNCTLTKYSYNTEAQYLNAYLDLDSHLSEIFIEMNQRLNSDSDKCSIRLLMPCTKEEKVDEKPMHYLSIPLVSENKDMVVFEDFIVHGFNWSENVLVVYFYQNEKWSKEILPL